MSLKSVYMTSDTKDLAYSKKDVSAIVDACHVHDALVEALEEANEKLAAAFDTLKNLSKARYPCPEEFAVLKNKLSTYIETIKPDEQALKAAKGVS